MRRPVPGVTHCVTRMTIGMSVCVALRQPAFCHSLLAFGMLAGPILQDRLGGTNELAGPWYKAVLSHGGIQMI